MGHLPKGAERHRKHEDILPSNELQRITLSKHKQVTDVVHMINAVFPVMLLDNALDI